MLIGIMSKHITGLNLDIVGNLKLNFHDYLLSYLQPKAATKTIDLIVRKLSSISDQYDHAFCYFNSCKTLLELLASKNKSINIKIVFSC